MVGERMTQTHRKVVGMGMQLLGGAVAVGAMLLLGGAIYALASGVFAGVHALLAVLAALTGGLAIMFTGQVLAGTMNPGRCPECDYDLRGQREGGCPECGWSRNVGEATARDVL